MHLFLAGLLVAAGPSGAEVSEDPSAREAASRVRVEVTVSGPASVRGPVVDRIRETLEPLELELSVVEVDELDIMEVLRPTHVVEGGALAHIFVTAQSSPELFVVDSTWERILVRRLPAPHGMDEVLREEIAVITGSSVEALLAGGRIGISTREFRTQQSTDAPPPAVEAPPPQPEPEPESEPEPLADETVSPEVSPALASAVGVAYATRAFRHDLPPIHSARIGFKLRGEGRLGLGGGAWFGVAVPPSVAIGGLRNDLLFASGQFFIGLESASRWPQLHWVGELAGGADLAFIRPRAVGGAGPEVEPGPRRTQLLATTTARGGIAVYLGPGDHKVRLTLLAELWVHLSRLTLTSDDGQREVSAWPVSPGLSVGLGYSPRTR